MRLASYILLVLLSIVIALLFMDNFVLDNKELNNRFIFLQEYKGNLKRTTIIPESIYKIRINREKNNIEFKTDNEGYITNKLINGKSLNKKKIKIIFTGGSLVEGRDTSQEKIFSNKILDYLPINQFDFITLNAATFGNNILNDLAILSFKIVNQKPNYIFYLNGVVDHALLARYENYKNIPINHRFSVINKLNIVDILKKKLENKFYRSQKYQTNIISKSSLDLYSSYLSSYVSTAKDFNIKIVLMTYPSPLFFDNEWSKLNYTKFVDTKLSYKDYSDDLKKINEQIRQVALKKNISYIDLEKILIEEKYFTDLFHLSIEGHKRVAELISKFLNLQKF